MFQLLLAGSKTFQRQSCHKCCPVSYGPDECHLGERCDGAISAPVQSERSCLEKRGEIPLKAARDALPHAQGMRRSCKRPLRIEMYSPGQTRLRGDKPRGRGLLPRATNISQVPGQESTALRQVNTVLATPLPTPPLFSARW